MRWVWAAVLLVASCGKKPQRVAPVARDAALAVAAAPADAAPPTVDTVSGSSALAPPDAGTPHRHAGERAITIDKPLRGTDAAHAPVFVARGDDPADLVTRAFDDLDPHIPVNARVVIKLNLFGFDRMKPGKPDNGVTGRITDPAFVRALVTTLRSRGVEDITLVDGSAAPELWRPLLELSGYQALSDELGVPLVDLNAGQGDQAPWHLRLPWAKRIKDELHVADILVGRHPRPYFIDVPKLKLHRFAVLTAAIKNLMGTVQIGEEGQGGEPWRRRWKMHRELLPWLNAFKADKSDDRAAYRKSLAEFSERLADMYGVMTPDLVLIEGTPAMQGDGFARVIPYGGRGILIASENGCFADYVAARFFGLADSDALEQEIGVRMPPAILAVARRYYGGLKALRAITVRGDDLAPPAGGAWYKAMAPFEIGTKPL